LGRFVDLPRSLAGGVLYRGIDLEFENDTFCHCIAFRVALLVTTKKRKKQGVKEGEDEERERVM
jgi:hypothetical protein